MNQKHIRLIGVVGEKTEILSQLLEVSAQVITNKLLEPILDEAIINTRKFLDAMDSNNKKMFLEIFNGTLEQLNKRGKK